MHDYLDAIPARIRGRLALEASRVIRMAAQMGADRWGVTPFPDGFRVNAGWTEIMTVSGGKVELVIVEDLVIRRDVRKGMRIYRARAKGARGFYKTVRGSVRVEFPLESARLRAIFAALKPALAEAIRRAGCRPAGYGVKRGHRQALVEAIGRAANTKPPVAMHRLPKPTVKDGLKLMEGSLKQMTATRYSRRVELRQRCIAIHGTTCKICKFSFAQQFGSIGQGFIHVHHIRPLASRKRARVIDPKRDLIPVCPNCHAMIHSAEPPRSVMELRALIRRNHRAEARAR